MGAHDSLIEKLERREARIGIIGLGYVGLPLALAYTDAGFPVLGFDIDPDKVRTLDCGGSYIERITPERITQARENGFQVTAAFERAKECDALIICVPTPLNRHREPDLSFITNTVDTLCPHLQAGQMVSLESTTYPGTTEEELLPRIENQGLKVGQDVFLVYSPEREDPGNPRYNTQAIPKVVGGQTEQCLQAGIALYQGCIDTVVPVRSTQAAEMTKLLENIHRAVNIGLVNEMKIVADKMGIDIFEVIDAAATKPFGFTPYYPGPGLGGHCIPVVSYSDPHVPTFPIIRKARFNLESVALDETTLPHFDALLLCTDHDRFDYDLVQQHGKLIIDTRGRYRGNTSANLRHA